MNPAERIRQGFRHRLHAAGNRIIRHCEIPDRVIHLDAGVRILAGPFGLRALKPQMNAIPGRGEFHIGRLPAHDRRRDLIEGIGFRIIAVININPDESIFLHKHEPDAVIPVLVSGILRGLIITPRGRIIGLRILAGHRIDRYFLRFPAVLVRYQAISHPAI